MLLLCWGKKQLFLSVEHGEMVRGTGGGNVFQFKRSSDRKMSEGLTVMPGILKIGLKNSQTSLQE